MGALRRIWEQNGVFEGKLGSLAVKFGFIYVALFCIKCCLLHRVINVLNCIFCKSFFNFQVFTDLMYKLLITFRSEPFDEQTPLFSL